jgi:hypothetical protein
MNKKLDTTKIKPTDTGKNDFQPSCISWSYRKRGKVALTQTNQKAKIEILTPNQIGI